MGKVYFSIRFTEALLIVMVACQPSALNASWKMKEMCNGDPNLYGDFPTKSDCERKIIPNGTVVNGIRYDGNCWKCIGSDSPSGAGGSSRQGGSSSSSGNSGVDLGINLAGDLIKNIFLNQQQNVDDRNTRLAREEAKREQERERQRQLERERKEQRFQKDKSDLIGSLKSSGSPALKMKSASSGNGLKLKTSKGLSADMKVDHCLECEKMLFSLVEIGLNKSAAPESFIYESRISYSNCMIKDSEECENTAGKLLYKALAVCKTLEDVEVAYESAKGLRNGGTDDK